jgi:hypothetical protein
MIGRSARSSFFNSYHSLDKNVEYNCTSYNQQGEKNDEKEQYSPRKKKDPFAEFTTETLDSFKNNIPTPLTTTEYSILTNNHITTNTEEEEKIDKYKKLLLLKSKNGYTSKTINTDKNSNEYNDPRVVFLRECREHQVPPVSETNNIFSMEAIIFYLKTNFEISLIFKGTSNGLSQNVKI